jgi:hypothetical protein
VGQELDERFPLELAVLFERVAFQPPVVPKASWQSSVGLRMEGRENELDIGLIQ